MASNKSKHVNKKLLTLRLRVYLFIYCITRRAVGNCWFTCSARSSPVPWGVSGSKEGRINNHARYPIVP